MQSQDATRRVSGVSRAIFGEKIATAINAETAQDECTICLDEFEPDSMVTPLPCDVRHYFHTACIQ